MKKLIAIGHLFISQFVYCQNPSKEKFSLKAVFGTGTLKASARQFSMFTQNKGGLSDYYGVAIGAGMRYETTKWRNWQFAFGGYFVNDLLSSDFSRKDPTTNATSRYDSGLYDVDGIEEKSFLSRVEELNVKCFLKEKTWLTWGKQNIKSPLVNLQDGRMTPSMMEGVYFESGDLKKLKIEGGWMYKSSPRSTFKWFPIANSIGLYPMGLNADGKKGNYLNNLSSRGLFLFGLNYSPMPNQKLIIWNYLIENISNTSFLQWNQELGNFKYGLQSIYQKTVGNGGNPKPELAYVLPTAKAVVLGGMIGQKFGNQAVQLNFTRITKAGRFQFPREWGRDPFFTFLPRERNEGLGDVSAVSLNLSKNFSKKNLKFELGAGYYDLPDVKNPQLNKYGMPSYFQVNFDTKYRFKKAFEGLELQFLVAQKVNQGKIYNDEKYRINKVDMSNWNLVLNYSFEKK